MKKLLLLTTLVIISTVPFVSADMYVPEFDKMQILKCDINETVYNQDNSVVTKTSYHRFFRLDDENKKLYLQKEPVDTSYYDNDKISFKIQSMTDDFISTSDIEIDRNTKEYKSSSTIEYDNTMYGTRYGKATGICNFAN